jgi:hypothetical protein
MNVKKIVITYEHGLGGDTIGGGQRILIELINQLQTEHEITVITPKMKNIRQELHLSPNVDIIYSKYSNIAFVSGIFVFYKYMENKAYQNDITISFTSEIYWLVIVRNFLFFKISSYLAAPDLTGFNNINIFSKLNVIRKRFELFLFMKGFSKADIKIAIGKKIKNEAIEKFNISDIKVVYPGINYSYLKKPINKTNDLLNILYIGRLDFKQKPLNNLVEAIKITSNLVEKFHIIGNGPEYTYFENIKIKNLKEKLCLYGSVDIIDSYEILKNIDLVVLPSINESFMLTVYEMISLGFVTVYNDVADLKENLKNIKTAFCTENTVIAYVEFIRGYKNLNISEFDLMESSNYISKNFNWKSLANEMVGD